MLLAATLLGCCGGGIPAPGETAPDPPEGMIYIPGGELWFGSTEKEIDLARRMSENYIGRITESKRVWFEDEVYRLVRIRPFFIDRYEVTNEEYERYLTETGRDEEPPAGRGNVSGKNFPVTGVNWHEANAYATWAGKRLPTAEEWEWAARGAERRIFPWGNGMPDGTRANYADLRTSFQWRDLDHDDGNSGPAPVGSYPEGATPEGVFDMGGNAREWTASAGTGVIDPRDGRIYAWNSRHAVPGGNRMQPIKMYYVRGGSWESAADDLRCSDVRMLPPSRKVESMGFRCVQDAEPAFVKRWERTGDER